MTATRILSRGLWSVVLAAALTLPALAQDDPKLFTGAKDSKVRHSLFKAWKAQHQAGVKAPSAPAVNGAPAAPYVGRASMVINSAGTVLYTKNFLGANATCDVFEIQAQNSWLANTAIAVGAVVRPTAAPLQPNGFDGFNFQASNGGTTGATEPTWPTSIGATVNDNGITWTAIAFDPANFVGCTPMQIISRASGGAETILAQEGNTLPDGSQLAGWSEFMAMNESGLAAFRAALAGYPFSDRDDEGESGIFTAGPGAGALTRIAATSTTIGGRTICGFSAMVGMNNVGQVVYDTYPGPINNGCDEQNHGIVRFSPGGPGNQLLVEQGSSVGSPAASVIGFGKDDNSVACSGCEYSNIDGVINASGHVPVVLNLSDATQGVFNLTGPGAATQVVRLPTGSIGPRASINDSDQLVYRATTGGVDRIFRFTPPSTFTTIASVGDTVNGKVIVGLGTYTDINASGNVVFQAATNAPGDAFYYYDGTVAEVATGPTGTLAAEMITVNDANQVAYVTGSQSPEGPEEGSEGAETGGAFSWTKAGGSVKFVQVGDVVNADTVTSIYAEHQSFVKRQFSQAGCLATAYTVLNDDPEFDCTEGGTGFCNPPLQKGGQLFISCSTGACPTITLAPPTLPGATQGTPYNQLITASGGQAPYSFAVTTGALPSGITLTAGGTLSGTPTVTGTFPFTITATDANACPGSLAYSLVVGGPTQVTVVLNPPSRIVVVGANTSLTVSINIAQATDTIVTLSSANAAIVTVPASVTILAGQTSANFTANGVAIGGPVTITANLPPSFLAPPATASITVIAVPVATIPTLGSWGFAILGLLLAAVAVLLTRR